MVYGSVTRTRPAVAYVRVRLYSGDTIHESAQPVAVAYLGMRASDYPAERLGFVRRWRLAREYRGHVSRRHGHDDQRGSDVA